jgi:hypothetical protein
MLPDSTEGNPVNPCYDRLEAGSTNVVTTPYTMIQSKPKMSAQGRSRNTNLAATPNRPKQKRHRGQGK